PSATAGELRGPRNPPGSVEGCASYVCFQISLPLAASRQRSVSPSPSRERTYSRSPTKAGVAAPSPTGTDHFLVNSDGQVEGALKSLTLASRLGPRHWGQSATANPARMSHVSNATECRLKFTARPPGPGF